MVWPYLDNALTLVLVHLGHFATVGWDNCEELEELRQYLLQPIDQDRPSQMLLDAGFYISAYYIFNGCSAQQPHLWFLLCMTPTSELTEGFFQSH